MDYVTIWSSTDTVDLGTSTGGPDMLGSNTVVSVYTRSATTTAATSTMQAPGSTVSASETSAGQASRTGSAASTASSCGTEAVAIARMLAVGLLAVMCFL